MKETVIKAAHRWSIFSRLSLLSLQARSSTEPSVSLSSWWSSITTSTLWSVFASRTRRTSRAGVTLWCKKLSFILTFYWKNPCLVSRDTHIRARRSHSASSTRETSSTLLKRKKPVNINTTRLLSYMDYSIQLWISQFKTLTGAPWAPRAPLGPETPVGPWTGKNNNYPSQLNRRRHITLLQSKTKYWPQVQEHQMVPEVQENRFLLSVQTHQPLPSRQADHLHPGSIQ